MKRLCNMDSLKYKTDEIEFLDELREALKHTDTYLKDLFTVDMVIELQSRIRNDFPCDVYTDLEGWRQEAQDKANAMVHMAAEIEGARQQVNERQETINHQAKRINDLNDNFAETVAKNNTALLEIVKQSNDYMDQVGRLENVLSNREMELCQLKSKLYDMEHK